MKFLAIIPARYASSRFPGKPLADICGKSMIQRVYERTSQQFEYCWVATDDQRIFDAVRGFGGNVTMTSDKHRSGTDRAAEALNNVEHETGMAFDVVVNVQGDEPLIAHDHLNVVSALFDDNTVQIATLVKPFSATEDVTNPNWPKVVFDKNFNAIYFSRSVIPFMRNTELALWQSKHQYYKHIGLYAYRTDVLREITKLPQSELELAESLEQLRWIENGYKIRVGVTNVETVSIDTPEDLQRVIAALK